MDGDREVIEMGKAILLYFRELERMEESVVERGNQEEIGWRRSPGGWWSSLGGGAPPWQLHAKKLSAIGGGNVTNVPQIQ